MHVVSPPMDGWMVNGASAARRRSAKSCPLFSITGATAPPVMRAAASQRSGRRALAAVSKSSAVLARLQFDVETGHTTIVRRPLFACRTWLETSLGSCRCCGTCCWFSASALRRGRITDRHRLRRRHRRHRIPANRCAARTGARARTHTVVTTALLAQTLRLAPARVARQSRLACRLITRYNARAARPPAARPPAPPPIAPPTASHRTTRPPPPAGRASGTSSTLAATTGQSPSTTTTGHGGRPKAMSAATTIPMAPSPARSSASSSCWL